MIEPGVPVELYLFMDANVARVHISWARAAGKLLARVAVKFLSPPTAEERELVRATIDGFREATGGALTTEHAFMSASQPKN